MLARALPFVLALALVPVASCGRSPAPRAAAAPSEGRFPHAAHLPPALAWPGKKADQVCRECHRPKTGAPAVLARPGSDDHAPCDREHCHRDAFTRAPGPLCAICHAANGPGAGLLPSAELVPYPPNYGPRYLASSFSHRQHLDRDKMEREVGFHVSCLDCHARTDSGQLTPPSHDTCARCHAAEATGPGVPSMGECLRCHQRRNSPPARTRALIVGDLHFSHAAHRLDRKNTPILCAECHQGTSEIDDIGERQPPPTSACVRCHDDPTRVSPRAAMKVCETCHATRAEGIGALPPRSHLPREERPDNHTLAFREDHAREARSQPEVCATCHSFMSGTRRDTCDQCHQVMRPQSHTVSWIEFDHGPAAALEPQKCATCHGADFCIACHSQPPRSHFPLAAFRLDHGIPASIDTRACLNCHDPSTGFCTASGCHTVGPGGLPR